MKNEFTLAFNELIEEKQLPKEIILQALESAMVSAYRRAVNGSNAQHVEAKIDPETGKVEIFAEKEVVESVEDERTEVTVEEAHRFDPLAEPGTMVVVETTPQDFGRVAAQTARQVIQQRIRDAERNAQMAYYEKQLGEIVGGIVQAVNAQGLTIGLEMKAEGLMPRKEMIGGERFRIHDRVRALVAEVKDIQRGTQIVLSRTHRNFLRRLLENEVPEIYHGVVDIRSIAREPGQRAKVAVSATQPGIDPVGACVGIRGVRIQAIVRELHDEKIDVIEWNSDPAQYIAKAISPARVSGVYLNENSTHGKTATVVVPDDQLSLAIGRDGQNARLAAKLTGWRIDIKSLPEAALDSINKLQNDPDFAEMANFERENTLLVETMLSKKSEGRPLTPEEYDIMTHFVDRVERRLAILKPAEKEAEETLARELLLGIPTDVLEKDILDSGLADHVAFILQEAGYLNVRDLALKMKTRPDDILRLQGIGPRAMQEINSLLERLVPADTAVQTVEPIEEVQDTETVEIPAETRVEVLAETETIAQSSLASEVTPLEPAAVETTTGEISSVSEEGEEEPSLDQLFILKPEVLKPIEESEEEEEEGDSKKKKKKKVKHVEVEYDPDRDMTLVHKKHKRGDSGWEW